MKKILSLILALCLVSSFAVLSSAENAGTVIPFSEDWIIEANSESNSDANSVLRAFDGSRDTYWHSYFRFENGAVVEKAEYPHTITVTFPEKRNVSGWRYTTRNDNASGIFLSYEIYASEDGSEFKLIYRGEMPEYATGINVAEFAPHVGSWGNVSMKAIKIAVTESRAGHGTAAEIEFFENGEGETVKEDITYSEESPYGDKLSTAGWSVTASSEAAGNSVKLVIDGNKKNYWHTPFSFKDGVTIPAEYPHFIQITLPEVTKVSGLLYYPRTDNATGSFQDYKVYLSTDGENFTLEKSGTFPYQPGSASDFKPSFVSWEEKEVKAVKIETERALGNHGTCAEIELYSGVANIKEEVNPLDFEGEEGEHATKCYVKDKTTGKSKRGVSFVSRNGWQASVSSDQSATISQMFDGDKATYWHTNFKAVGGDIKEHDLPPHYILLILPETTEISGLSLLPRQDQVTGSFFNINIYAAETDDNEWTLIKEDYACSGSTQVNEIYFSANIKVKKLRIEATTTKSGYGTMAELNLFEKDSNKDTVDYATFKEYEEKYALYKIDKTLFKATSNATDWDTHSPSKILDGAEDTFWQTVALDHGPVATLSIDMGNVYEVKRIDCVPRETADFHGCWLKATLYASVDGENWEAVLTDVTFEKSLDINELEFENSVKARYFEFEIYEYFADRVSLGEMYFYQDLAGKKAFEEENMEKYVLKIGSKEISYKNKGEEGVKEIDVAPFIVNGSTMIPLRGLLELMGAEITWYGEDQSVDIDNGSYFIHLQIDNKLVYVKHPSFGDIRYTLLSIPVIVEGRTFIPLRFVSEQLGYNVEWNGETQEITISIG